MVTTVARASAAWGPGRANQGGKFGEWRYAAFVSRLLLACLLAGPPSEGPKPDAVPLNQARLQLQKASTSTLAGWSAINIGSGAAGFALAEGRNRHFSEMNLYWGLVNGVIAGVSIGVLARDLKLERSRVEVLEEYRKARLAFLVNGGLDLIYISGGVVLWQAARTAGGSSPNALQSRLIGYGQSVVLQGAFLLAFDAAMYLAYGLVQRDHTDDSAPVWNLAPAVSQSGAGVALSGRF